LAVELDKLGLSWAILGRDAGRRGVAGIPEHFEPGPACPRALLDGRKDLEARKKKLA
jgi:hypothetical protein